MSEMELNELKEYTVNDSVERKRSFIEIGCEIGKLVTEKQIAYGDSFGKSGKILEILYPNGIRVDQYPDALTITRIIDKLFRIATQKDAFGESPYNDIAGYAILGVNQNYK